MKVWIRKECGCVNAILRSARPVTIRCSKHVGKRAKKGRELAHFNEDGHVRAG